MNTMTSRKAVQEYRKPANVVITAPAQLAWFDSIGGERLAVHVSAKQSGGAYTIMESIAAPGAASPLHTHREDEVFFVIEGVVTFSIDGAMQQAMPGTTLVVPGGTVHAWKNATLMPARVLVTFSPGGLETLFQQVAGKSMDEIVALASTHGTHVVGPPMA